MTKVVSNLKQDWQQQLALDYPEQSAATRASIVCWLLGEDSEHLERLNPVHMEIAQKAMTHRYQILRQRYLGVEREKAYQNLMNRLTISLLLRDKIRTWVTRHQVRAATVLDILQKVIQELLQTDYYIQQQIVWIAECTDGQELRNALLLTSLEEYCLRSISNQPLLVYKFINYLQRSFRKH